MSRQFTVLTSYVFSRPYDTADRSSETNTRFIMFQLADIIETLQMPFSVHITIDARAKHDVFGRIYYKTRGFLS